MERNCVVALVGTELENLLSSKLVRVKFLLLKDDERSWRHRECYLRRANAPKVNFVILLRWKFGRTLSTRLIPCNLTFSRFITVIIFRVSRCFSEAVVLRTIICFNKRHCVIRPFYDTQICQPCSILSGVYRVLHTWMYAISTGCRWFLQFAAGKSDEGSYH